jgi:hypothetical protein
MTSNSGRQKFILGTEIEEPKHGSIEREEGKESEMDVRSRLRLGTHPGGCLEQRPKEKGSSGQAY